MKHSKNCRRKIICKCRVDDPLTNLEQYDRPGVRKRNFIAAKLCSWFLRLEEEYCDSTDFYDSKRRIEILQVLFLAKVISHDSKFGFCFQTLTSVLKR